MGDRYMTILTLFLMHVFKSVVTLNLLKNFKVYQVSYKCLILKFSKEHQPKLFDKEHIEKCSNYTNNLSIDIDTHTHIN